MENPTPKLPDVLESVSAALAHDAHWIVGGTVRDLLAGRKPVDYDIAVQGNPADSAAAVARSFGGRPVCIGRGRFRTWRVAALGRLFDFARIEGGGIEQDLRRRDFTVNAMAIAPEDGRLIDPFGGLDDLRQGTLQVVSASVFDRDPVRLVRAFRLAAQFNLELSPETENRIRRQAALAGRSAGERIRDELFKLLAEKRASPMVENMLDTGVLGAILPELSDLAGCSQGGFHQHDVMSHTLLSLSHLESILEDPASWLPGQGRRTRQSDCCRQEAQMKLAVLLHDIGKPATRRVRNGRTRFHGHSAAGFTLADTVFTRLRMSNRHRRFVGFLIRHHIRPLQLFVAHQRGALTRRGRTRFFLRSREWTPALMLIALADMAGKQTPPGDRFAAFAGFADELLENYFTGYCRRSDEPPLITGRDLISVLGLPPSPIFGKILAGIEAERLAGGLTTRREALERARQLAAAWG